MLPLLLLAIAAAPEPGAVLEISPARVRPGDAFLVTVRGAAEPPSGGEAAGQPLAFWPAPGGFEAIGALPIETGPGTLPVTVSLAGAALAGALEVAPPDFPERRLTVAARFVVPPPPVVRRRIEADHRAFLAAWAQPPSPPLFSGRFVLPREDRLNARFGEKRLFNGRKPSQHYGLDLGGDLGAPIAATGAGRVVLVRNCWASGRSVVLWHGAGVFSTYFHMSKVAVKVGQTVARGQLLGQVGRSGRVTGPHLHWGVRVAGLYVDPESLLRLPLD